MISWNIAAVNENVNVLNNFKLYKKIIQRIFLIKISNRMRTKLCLLMRSNQRTMDIEKKENFPEKYTIYDEVYFQPMSLMFKKSSYKRVSHFSSYSNLEKLVKIFRIDSVKCLFFERSYLLLWSVFPCDGLGTLTNRHTIHEIHMYLD